MNYNIVLITPSTYAASKFYQLAKHINDSTRILTNYLLRDGVSILHASVFQFKIEEESPAFTADKEHFFATIWQLVQESWQVVLAKSDRHLPTLSCTLPTTINYKYDASGPYAGTTWAELVLNKKENSFLQLFHDTLCEKLAPLGLKICNAHGPRYNPHFTLFNTNQSLPTDILRKVPVDYQLDEVLLMPALGRADGQWQFTEILHQYSSPSLDSLTVVDGRSRASSTWQKTSTFMSFSSLAKNMLCSAKTQAAIAPAAQSIAAADIKKSGTSMHSDAISTILSSSVMAQPFYVHRLPWNQLKSLSSTEITKLIKLRAELNSLEKQFSLAQKSRTAQIGLNEDQFADIAALFKLTKHLLNNALRFEEASSSDLSAIQNYMERIREALPKLQNPIFEYNLQ